MRRILICLLLLALLCGCTGQMLPAGKSKFTFYYRRADAQNDESYVSASGALAEKEVTLGGDVRTEDVLAAYFEEPDDETLRSLFPEGTACLGTKLQNGVLVLDMNEAYAVLSGYERTLAAAGLTLTLTQLDGVDAVRIKTPAGALLDKPSTRCRTRRGSTPSGPCSCILPGRTEVCSRKNGRFPIRAPRSCREIRCRRCWMDRKTSSCIRRFPQEHGFWISGRRGRFAR